LELLIGSELGRVVSLEVIERLPSGIEAMLSLEL
jgi:hypothetical protein